MSIKVKIVNSSGNSLPGTIDADYRGESGIILVNLSGESFVVESIQWNQVESRDESERGDGGFGHTGTK